MFKRWCFFAWMMLFLGCASLSREECMTADWQIIGFEDGSHGKPMTTIGAHRKACAKAGVTPDMNAYEIGHQKGLASFCTVENGFAQGLQGRRYDGICASANESGFLSGWNVGKDRFNAVQKVERLRTELTQLEERLSTLYTDMDSLEQNIISSESTPEQRQEMLDTMKTLQEDEKIIQTDLRFKEGALARAERSLERLVQKQKQLGFE